MAKLGIWVNQKEAYLIHVSGEARHTCYLTHHLYSEIEPNHRTTGGMRGPAPYFQGSASAPLANKLKERRAHQFHCFSRSILPFVRESEEVVIFGPGLGKLRLEREISRHKDLAPKIRAVQPADSMTENQIVAHTLEFFGEPPKRRFSNGREVERVARF